MRILFFFGFPEYYATLRTKVH